ncbi:MAG TPA: diadenylate cyclase CdaA [Gemmatimonadales bacterium]|nr:diadenylate cyclase CdaA [Gemmatimonadales bacterium]
MHLEQIPLATPTWRDLLEILIVAAVLYRLLRFLAGTRALQILLGVLVLAAIYAAAFALKLSMITYLLGVVFTYGAFAALVVFQPELRHALARLGQSRLFALFGGPRVAAAADEIAQAVDRLSRSATGAIIAIEQDGSLEEWLATGTAMRAGVSADLLASIFSPYAPLHDGAVIVRGHEIVGAGCILPLAQYAIADRSLGTRHRAAIGLSEESDALVLVVSEETSTISLARGGKLERGLSADRVRELLAPARLAGARRGL